MTWNLSEIQGKRLLICEEALINYNAHFFSWIKAIRDINAAAGVDVTVAGHVDVDQQIQSELNVLPAFSTNNWSSVYNDKGRLGRLLGIFSHNRLVKREVSSVLEKTGPVDCILCPAVRLHHLLGWRSLCRKYLGTKFKRLAMFILTSEAQYNDDFSKFHFKRSSFAIKSAIRSFRKDVDAGRVIFCGDSHVTCGEYQSLTGIPFQVFPSPGAPLALKQETTTEANGTGRPGPVFLMLGVSYFDKGIDLFQEAILRFLAEYPQSNARFIVQWAKETIDYSGNRISIDDRLRKAPQVELIERPLSGSEYQDKFSQADVVVLPYRRHVYFNRLSGVAVEAACSGVPMIVTENTWLSWAMKEFGAGVETRDSDASSLYDQLKFCVDNQQALRQQAIERQPVALQYNSTENYLRCLWGSA